MTGLAVGFLAGFLACRLIVRWGAMWRVCCREHYATHAECECRDCVRDRAVSA